MLPEAAKLVGEFTRDMLVSGTDNERKLRLVATPQICDLYGTDFRSMPVFFVQDDDDYFENDEATEQMVTFPPDDFMLRLARATQRLYYPEFLPDSGRPVGLPSSGAADRAAGVSESFGTLRYGTLLEILLYDCRRYMSLSGPTGGFLPEMAEAWVMPSMGWQNAARRQSAVDAGRLQADAGSNCSIFPVMALLGVASEVSRSWAVPAAEPSAGRRVCADRHHSSLSGDLHALAEGRIQRYGNLDLRRNPIVSC